MFLLEPQLPASHHGNMKSLAGAIHQYHRTLCEDSIILPGSSMIVFCLFVFTKDKEIGGPEMSTRPAVGKRPALHTTQPHVPTSWLGNVHSHTCACSSFSLQRKAGSAGGSGAGAHCLLNRVLLQ